MTVVDYGNILVILYY